MVEIETAYLLARACTHRRLARQAQACEVRLVHRQFVRRYQARLLELRRERHASQRLPSPPAPDFSSIIAAIGNPPAEVGPRHHDHSKEEDIFA